MAIILTISFFILAGILLMLAAIFTKKKDMEKLKLYGANELLEILLNLVFSFSSVQVKRILLFSLGFLWTAFFVYMILASE